MRPALGPDRLALIGGRPGDHRSRPAIERWAQDVAAELAVSAPQSVRAGDDVTPADAPPRPRSPTPRTS
jgi:hypothetical protein